LAKPTPQPSKIRPKMRRISFPAEALKTVPTMNKIPASNIVCLRPSFLVTGDAIMEATKAAR